MKRSQTNWKRPRTDESDEPVLERVVRENGNDAREMMVDNGLIVYVKYHGEFETEKYVRINPNMEKEILEFGDKQYSILWKRDLTGYSEIRMRVAERYKEDDMHELECEVTYYFNVREQYGIFYVMREDRYNMMREYVIPNVLDPVRKSESYSCMIYLDPEYRTDQEGKKMIKRLKRNVKYSYMRLFIREMQIYEKMAMNPHPNICRMSGRKIIEDDAGSIFPAMVLEQGLDLRNTVVALERRYDDMGKMRQYYLKMESFVDQMIMGIRYFHQMGYVHFDVKLENFIFVNGVVKLIDFGQSEKRSVIRMDETIRYKGTSGFTPIEIRYMKPMYRDSFDERVDVWPLGICILSMIGRDAYEYKVLDDIEEVMYYVMINDMRSSQNRMDEIVNSMLEEYEKETRHGKEMRELVYRMMKVDPRDRTKLENVRTPVIGWNIV